MTTISVKEWSLLDKYIRLGRMAAEETLIAQPDAVTDSELNTLHALTKRINGEAVNLVLERKPNE